MKNLATAFLLMGSSFIFTAAHASQTEPEAVVTFAGYKNTQPVYKLNIKNPENVKCHNSQGWKKEELSAYEDMAL